MPKITYIEKNFNNATLAVINQANKIIKKYETDGFYLTLRQLYYQFVTTGEDNMSSLEFPIVNDSYNNEKSYNRLSTIISNARLAGLIDWRAIEDRTRNLVGNAHWSNPGEIVKAAARSFKLDHWKGQEFKPEVWIEKEALIGVIAGICRELDVDYFACKGYVSQSEMWMASQRLINYCELGQTPVIIHLGDHDPSGIDMTRDIQDRQTLFFQSAGCNVKRIALNMNQVDQYNPPPNPAKLSDSRCAGYIAKYGSSSWELDALEPRVLRDLIKNTVTDYRDEEIYNKVLKQEKEYLNILARVEENWKTL